MADIPHASVKQLAYKIKGTGRSTPRFAFFLGAGASRQSGVITAGEMIRFFKEQIIVEGCPEELKSDKEKDAWLKRQDWYKRPGSEYSKLFEQYEPKEIGRQRYIESIIEGKTPSFGYVVLANLMASNYVNSIITTNFDDLMYSACTSFTSIRPIVYAYGVLASEMRVTAPRPKILKLHGDYLYSAVKNTDREIAAQDPNMARQVSQVLGEYGLAIVGYSGGDGSIMKILGQISEKNDLYWCVHRGTEPSEQVKKLLQEKGGFLIEIDGFDEMINEVRGIVGFDVGVMIGSTQERQDRMIENLRSFSMQYSAGILREIVDALKEQLEQQQDQISKTEALDFFLKAYEAHINGDHRQAEKFYNEAIKRDPNDTKAHNNLALIYLAQNKVDEAVAELKQAINLDPQDPWAHWGLWLAYDDAGKYEEAIVECRVAIELEPRNAAYHNSLGWSYLRVGNLANAEQSFQEATRLDPTLYAAFLNLGLLRALQGQPAEAKSLWEQGLALSKGTDNASKLTRALYTLAVGDTRPALTDMQTVLKEGKLTRQDLRGTLQDAEIIAGTPSPPVGIQEVLSMLRAAMPK